jgi:hypothetical protein
MTSETGHTKGPWLCDKDKRGTRRVFAGNHEIVRALSTHGTRRISKAEREANAHLISAAPDMLKALQSFSVYLVEDDDRVWLSIQGESLISFKANTKEAAALLQLDAIQRAAIRKARGETDG